MPGMLVDGNDLLAVHQAVRQGVERARSGDGPTLIEARTFRMGGHSTSDDPTRYVPKDLVVEWERKDPVQRFERFLAKRGLWNKDLRETMLADAVEEVNAAVRTAQAVPKPGLETIFSDVYAEIPRHLRAQGQAAFDLARRKGEAEAGAGAFPL
jgi:TPP-dependent pyruvate/acetoin dehydrogenase alpha subunit